MTFSILMLHNEASPTSWWSLGFLAPILVPRKALYLLLWSSLAMGSVECNILYVRKMRQKPSSKSLNPILCDTHAEESPTMNLQSSPQPTSRDARPSIIPLIVALSLHTLVVSLLNAKIKMGKMHTSQLSEMLVKANATSPLPHSLTIKWATTIICS